VATACYNNAHYLASELVAKGDFRLAYDAPFFHELTVTCPVPARDLNARLLAEGILGGYDLGQDDPALGNHLLLAVTELNTRKSIDRFVSAATG
jgi:glycine dehydrogenase subunit 1